LAARRFTESAGGRFGFWRSIERISLLHIMKEIGTAGADLFWPRAPIWLA
jgi:hypothetical protein